MKLYLVRHGNAESSSVNSRCPLSQKGRLEIDKVAKVMAKKKVKINRIECSVKDRAMETAEIIAAKVGSQDSVSVRDGLKPDDPINYVLDEIRNDHEDRMLVGHLPYMPQMLHALLGECDEAKAVSFCTGTVVCLSGKAGSQWSLDWTISP